MNIKKVSNFFAFAEKTRKKRAYASLAVVCALALALSFQNCGQGFQVNYSTLTGVSNSSAKAGTCNLRTQSGTMIAVASGSSYVDKWETQEPLDCAPGQSGSIIKKWNKSQTWYCNQTLLTSSGETQTANPPDINTCKASSITCKIVASYTSGGATIPAVSNVDTGKTVYWRIESNTAGLDAYFFGDDIKTGSNAGKTPAALVSTVTNPGTSYVRTAKVKDPTGALVQCDGRYELTYVTNASCSLTASLSDSETAANIASPTEITTGTPVYWRIKSVTPGLDAYFFGTGLDANNGDLAGKTNFLLKSTVTDVGTWERSAKVRNSAGALVNCAGTYKVTYKLPPPAPVSCAITASLEAGGASIDSSAVLNTGTAVYWQINSPTAGLDAYFFGPDLAASYPNGYLAGKTNTPFISTVTSAGIFERTAKVKNSAGELVPCSGKYNVTYLQPSPPAVTCELRASLTPNGATLDPISTLSVGTNVYWQIASNTIGLDAYFLGPDLPTGGLEAGKVNQTHEATLTEAGSYTRKAKVKTPTGDVFCTDEYQINAVDLAP